MTPLPVFIFIYGLFLPESPLFKKVHINYLEQIRISKLKVQQERRSSVDAEYQPLVDNKEENYTNKRGWLGCGKLLTRDVWFPFILCTLNLVGQQAGGMKIIQGFQVEIFAEVYAKPPSQLSKNGDLDLNDNFNYLASVFLGVVRLVAALITAKYIKSLG